MAAQPSSSIYSEDSKNNGSIGIKKAGTINYQWRPTTKNGIDRSTERNLESTVVSTPQMSYKTATMNSLLPSKSNSSEISQNGSLAAKANNKYSSNSKTTMQHDKAAPITLTSSHNVRNLPPVGAGAGAGAAVDHIEKLAEKMQTTTILTKSKNATDDSDKIWLPQMDGIDVVLPLSTNQSSSSAATSTKDHKGKMTDEMLKTEECINSVLYGPRKPKRLPIFEEICPSSLFSDTENPH